MHIHAALCTRERLGMARRHDELVEERATLEQRATIARAVAAQLTDGRPTAARRSVREEDEVHRLPRLKTIAYLCGRTGTKWQDGQRLSVLPHRVARQRRSNERQGAARSGKER